MTTDAANEATATDTADDTSTDDPTATQPEHDDDSDTSADEPDTFPRAYVERLRGEAARYRTRAADRDTLAERLLVERVRATGRMADPTDLPYDDALLNDDDGLDHAIGDLLARKPHLASRRPLGDVGQGAATSTGGVNLAELLRG